jgi:hypothetical protein
VWCSGVLLSVWQVLVHLAAAVHHVATQAPGDPMEHPLVVAFVDLLRDERLEEEREISKRDCRLSLSPTHPSLSY